MSRASRRARPKSGPARAACGSRFCRARAPKSHCRRQRRKAVRSAGVNWYGMATTPPLLVVTLGVPRQTSGEPAATQRETQESAGVSGGEQVTAADERQGGAGGTGGGLVDLGRWLAV